MRYLAIVLVLLACSHSEPAPAGMRVVTLSPSATEIVTALGARGALVGVDDFSGEIPGAMHVGSFLQPNIDAIVRLQPTVVVVDDVHADAAKKLADAGIATVECPMHALPDVETALGRVGDKLGKRAEADRAIADVEAAIDEARAHRPAKRPRVLAIIDRTHGALGNLVAAGPGSWLDELLAIAGAENVLAASGVRYPSITLEEVLRGKPDVILDISTQDPADWSALGQPVVVRAPDEPALKHPSPNIRAALTALATSLR